MPPGHTGREAAVAPSTITWATGHVFIAPWSPMPSTTVENPSCVTEPFADHTAQEDLAAGGTETDHVARDDVVPATKPSALPGRADHDVPTGEALADEVVGVAFEAQRHTVGHERTEAVAGRAGQPDLDRVVRKSLRPIHLL